MPYIPEKGDVILLDFDPGSGKEIMKTRPALVLSRKLFNQQTEMAIVAPITSTIRQIKLEVVLPDEMATAGAVQLIQLKSVDFIQRRARFIEKATDDVINSATKIAELIIR